MVLWGLCFEFKKKTKKRVLIRSEQWDSLGAKRPRYKRVSKGVSAHDASYRSIRMHVEVWAWIIITKRKQKVYVYHALARFCDY